MRKIVYTMHFKGRISPVSNEPSRMRTMGSATSCTLTSTVRRSGLTAGVKASRGGLAFLDSHLHLSGKATFVEDGTVCFGDDSAHVLHFSTIDPGRLTHTLEPGTMLGAAVCNIQGGEGQFAAASGFINCTFTLTDAGEFDQFHSGLIFLPEASSNRGKRTYDTKHRRKHAGTKRVSGARALDQFSR